MKNVIMFLCALGWSGQMALADDIGIKASSMKRPKITTEQRQKMADAHEKMAACLRSDKPLSDCQEEMMKSCKEGLGNNECPMMDGKGMHHGYMKHSDESSSKPTR